eukprot:gene11581-13516_t
MFSHIKNKLKRYTRLGGASDSLSDDDVDILALKHRDLSSDDIPSIEDNLLDDDNSSPQDHQSTDAHNFPNRYNDPTPEYQSNFMSRFLFTWVDETLKRGSKRPLELTDIPGMRPSLEVENAITLLQDINFTDSKYPIIKHIYCNLVIKHKAIFFLRALAIVSSIITPFLLKIDENSDPSMGWILCFALFVSATVNALSLQQGYWYGMHVCLEIRGSMMSLIFRKMLRLNNTSRRMYAGKVMNYVSVDVENFQEFFWNSFIDIVALPLQIILLLALLCVVIGWSGLVGFAVMGFSVPLSTFVINKLNVHYLNSLIFSDQRVKLIGEFISGIRFLKLYNWEKSFIDRITDQRNYQLNAARKKMILWAIDRTVVQMTMGVVLLVTFIAYTLNGHTLNAATAFPALTIFLTLRNPLQMAPEAFQRLLILISSCKRLEEYFQAPESLSYNSLLAGGSKSAAGTRPTDIVIENGEFDWNDGNDSTLQDIDNAPKNNDTYTSMDEAGATMFAPVDSLGIEEARQSVLKNINFRAPAGKLTVIVGRVGEGKTSLVAALIGEIHRVSGTVQTPPSIGYTPQNAWLVSGTFRENILFGMPFDPVRYAAVIEACSLKPDLIHLAAKDLTEIGERGVNVSGGQKQRISLARCLYGNADAFIMDEPLSAVDAEVGKHLFDKCIQGMMAGRTRILVTHQLQFIPSADHIVVMEAGELIQGTYAELAARGIDFESIMKTKVIDVDAPPTKPNDTNETTVAVSIDGPGLLAESRELNVNDCIVLEAGDATNELVQKSKLFVSEERNKGAIGAETYIPYFKSGGPTILYVAIIIVFFVSQVVMQTSDYWLVVWTSAKIQPDPGATFYLMVYAAFITAFGVMITARHLGIVYLTWKASKGLHERLIAGVFFSPCSFFDTNPSGRILNRFSKDISDIDNRLVESIADVLFCGSSVIVSLSMVVVLTPPIIIPFIILVFSLVTEAFQGLNSIRVFKQQPRFVLEMDKRIDLNQRLFYHSFSVNRWLGMRLEILTSIVVLLTGVFSLITTSITPALAGMIVSAALSITGILNWAIRQFTELEVRMNSVERVLAYVNSPSEGAREMNSPPPGWPHAGEIEFRDLEVRYRPTMDPSLRGLSAVIPPAAKVGIVGRTGAGKSTIGISLFRMIDASAGAIVIDGIDISTIGLSDLRSRLAVIPQDSFVYSGSVRMNLDPFDEHTDMAIWQALEKVHIKRVIEGLPLKLEYEFEEGGDGLSVGQKQLLCLARALLRDSKIVLMDEATASLDYETDATIKEAIAVHFKDRTVLTIAHRLDTIIESDKVMVIDAGRLIEYDNPRNLINTPTSRFKQLVQAQSTFLHSPSPTDTSRDKST